MGRGLSDLQRAILTMARANRVAEGLGLIVYSAVFCGRPDPERESEAWHPGEGPTE